LTLYWLLSGYSLRAWRCLAWIAVVLVGAAVLFQQFGFVGPPPTLRTSLIYTSQSMLSISDDPMRLTDWGKGFRIMLRLIGPLLLGLALLSVRNRIKR
jgi:predicted NAD-dependent protein-ADP-ribosyltransferase YbiA (DUF1768 family)